MSTKVDLARTTRHAYRLPTPIPSMRLGPVNNRQRAVTTSGASEDKLTAPPIPVDSADVRALGGATRRGQLGAEALAAMRRISVATLRVLRRFLILALVAVSMMAPLVIIGATGLQAALQKVTPGPRSAVLATWAAAATRTEASIPEPANLQVHVQTQDSLLSGGERQFRLAVNGGSSLDGPGDTTFIPPSLLVHLSIHPTPAVEGSVSVTPTRLIVTRNELRSTPIWIQLAADVPCGSELGALQVHVRELAVEGSQVARTVALPPVDCRPAPPAISEPR